MERKIVDAVLAEIQAHGFKFTMDDITARLHMSKSSLYKLVGSKDKLVHDFITELKLDFETRRRHLVNNEDDIYSKVEAFVKLYVEMFRPFQNDVYYDIKVLYYDEWQRWHEFQKENVEFLMQLLQQGIDKGCFRPVNINVVRQVLLVSAMSLAEYDFLQESNLTYADAVKALSDIILNGLRQA